MTNWMPMISDAHQHEYDPGQALAEPTPAVAAACTLLADARTSAERKRAKAALKAVTGKRAPPLTAADKAAICVATAKGFFRSDWRSALMLLTMAADRARKAGALRASLHVLREAQAIEFDVDRERLIDEITSDVVTGRYNTASVPAAAAPVASEPSSRAPRRSRTVTAGKKSARAGKKKDCGNHGNKKTTPTRTESPDARPLVIARAFDRLTQSDLFSAPSSSLAAHVTVFSTHSAGFVGIVHIAQGSRDDRTWRCPRCGSGAGELHVTASGRLECAACRDHLAGVSWRSFGPEVIALIERMVRGASIPTDQIIDAVTRHMEARA